MKQLPPIAHLVSPFLIFQILLVPTVTAQPQPQDGGALYQAHACASCHGKNGLQPISPDYPMLGGQNARYLLRQMIDIRDGTRTNALAATMRASVGKVSDEDFAIIAEWLSRK
ncbi:MAG: c-type cytochrome [Chromatiaceae bacterium]|nr:c-type cytochrome [Candidatus Thioaporhodococcus sediminis]